jgi:hypothetical protein
MPLDVAEPVLMTWVFGPFCRPDLALALALAVPTSPRPHVPTWMQETWQRTCHSSSIRRTLSLIERAAATGSRYSQPASSSLT